MAARDIVQSAAGSSGVATYVEDVFSTWLYDGNGSTQTITNGIDLAGKGGMVWIKARSIALSNYLFNTVAGAGAYMRSDTTSAQLTDVSRLSSFNSDGFSLGSNAGSNGLSNLYASWTFRKQPKFFDIVTYTGDGTNGRAIPHNLGSVPGCVIVKATSGTSFWPVYHRTIAATSCLYLNDTGATYADNYFGTNPTSTNFYVRATPGNGTNESGLTYVAYLFAHDAGGFGTSGSDNVISCGSFTTDASGNATVNLGYEMQYMLFKTISGAADSWYVADIIRGMSVAVNASILSPNTSTAEQTGFNFSLNATGFSLTNATPSVTYIYIAIRRPMKTPTSGTSVFTPFVYTGTNVDNRLVNAGQYTDMAWVRQRDSTTVAGMVVGDRMRGQPYLLTGSTAAEVNDADSFDAQLVSAVDYGNAWSSMTGFWVGNDVTSQLNASTVASNQIAECFKRAPGFFDIVCYTGTGVNRTINHNLGVAPELIIVKVRGYIGSWYAYVSPLGATKYMQINSTSAVSTSSAWWNDTAPTSTVFTVGTQGAVNGTADTYVAYLFASCPNVSKVGSYTGNGSSQTINCGFTSGARFVLIKRTDSTGDWYVWDTARGIVAANDPRISLNQTSAEATGDDSVDADNTGFIVNQNATTNINVNTATYIYLAIA